MDDVTDVRALIAQYANPAEPGLYTQIVRRLRACGTVFDDRIKLVMTQVTDEQYSLLPKPYLLVVPTLDRPRQTNLVTDDVVEFLNPRTVGFVAQFDAGTTDLNDGRAWGAGDQIDCAQRQLLIALVNWRPTEFYAPTIYGGMRVYGNRLPDVKVLYTFTFVQWWSAPEVCCEEPACTTINDVFINVRNDCGPIDPSECPECCP